MLLSLLMLLLLLLLLRINLQYAVLIGVSYYTIIKKTVGYGELVVQR